jgi:uncharacterized protein YdhG (YjbR/CyaY superfamily)
MRQPPRTIDEYLAGVAADKRAALQKLRRAIRSAVPRAEEAISYGIPAFRLDGRVLVFFAAATRHCSFFPGKHPVQVHAAALAKYDTSKGTVRFPATRPLPATLVRRLVRTRVQEYAAKTRGKTRRAPVRRGSRRAND